MNAEYMRETLIYVVMTEVEENCFGSKRKLIGAFEDIETARKFVKTNTEYCKLSIWNNRTGGQVG